MDRADETKLLCADCVGEQFLKAEIAKNGGDSVCSYCEEQGKTITIGEMADHFKVTLDQHFCRTPQWPSGLEYAMMKEGDRNWEREGETLVDLIQNHANVEPEVAEDVQSVLDDRHCDYELAQMGEEQPFGEDARYAERDVDDSESEASWRNFERGLKTQARYFSRTAEWTLQSIFEGISEFSTDDGRPVVVEAGPDRDLGAIHRARVFQSAATLERALGRPDVEVGPPPSREARAGRMNPHGISVLYGATDPLVALAEVRPAVGSRVVVGRFELIRPVRLLDLEALRKVQVRGSIFDPGFLQRLQKAKFLEWLSERITTPVMPNDEAYDYLPTQAVADFLATNANPLLHGIIYRSVQGAVGNFNVVLFHKAARVEPFQIPFGTKISASLYHWTDDGPETDYWVAEEVPSTAADATPLSAEVFHESDDYDDREFTLKLDKDSLQVHHIRGVSFTTDVFDVRRHRYKVTDAKF